MIDDGDAGVVSAGIGVCGCGVVWLGLLVTGTGRTVAGRVGSGLEVRGVATLLSLLATWLGIASTGFGVVAEAGEAVAGDNVTSLIGADVGAVTRRCCHVVSPHQATKEWIRAAAIALLTQTQRGV